MLFNHYYAFNVNQLRPRAALGGAAMLRTACLMRRDTPQYWHGSLSVYYVEPCSAQTTHSSESAGL